MCSLCVFFCYLFYSTLSLSSSFTFLFVFNCFVVAKCAFLLREKEGVCVCEQQRRVRAIVPRMLYGGNGRSITNMIQREEDNHPKAVMTSPPKITQIRDFCLHISHDPGSHFELYLLI